MDQDRNEAARMAGYWSAVPMTGTQRTLMRREMIAAHEAYVAPRSKTEAALASIWQDILGIDRVGGTDHFFDLGGDSLKAAALFDEIERKLGVSVSVSKIVECAVLEDLARVVSEATQGEGADCLVNLESRGDVPPLIFVHEITGAVLAYRHLVEALGGRRRILGLTFEDEVNDAASEITVAQMASRYVTAVKQAQPQGPYYLVGYSLGGMIAFEMACQLTSRGDEVALLAMIDTSTSTSRLTGLQLVARKLSIHLATLSKKPPKSWPGDLWAAVIKEVNTLKARVRPARASAQRPVKGEATASDASEQYELRALAREKEMLNAWATHRPSVYNGPVKLFRCVSDHGHQWSRECKGWSEYVRGDLELYDLPSNHIECMTPPAVALVAAYIGAWIGQYDPTASRIGSEG